VGTTISAPFASRWFKFFAAILSVVCITGVGVFAGWQMDQTRLPPNEGGGPLTCGPWWQSGRAFWCWLRPCWL